MIGIQMVLVYFFYLLLNIQVKRLRTLHNLNYVHRDLKPANIMLGYGKLRENTVYLIDFGLTKP